MDVGLCMIVKNEEAVLRRCLMSVRDIVSEIVVVDTGSTDRTKEIAAEFTDKIYDFAWSDDFAAARNFSFSKGTREYAMWLDADDVIEDPKNFADFLNKNPGGDVYMLRYDVSFDKNGEPDFYYYRERILRREKAVWEGEIHEAVPPVGRVIYGDISVSHRKIADGDPERNLRIFGKILSRRPLVPREKFYLAREFYHHNRLKEAENLFFDFIKCGEGQADNLVEACRALAEIRKKTDNEDPLDILLSALKFSPPTAGLCCDIGREFFEKGDYKSAAFWYQSALEADNGEFINPDYRGYIPCLQLCVCYYRLGNLALSKIYNEKAGIFKQGAEYEFNKKFFSNLPQTDF